LPNEYLQCDELAVDSIIKNFKKPYVDAPVYSLPRHNCSSSSSIPTELPAELLSTHLVWIGRSGAIPPLHPLYDGPYAVICRASDTAAVSATPVDTASEDGPLEEVLLHSLVIS
jgi:hypothetical protein